VWMLHRRRVALFQRSLRRTSGTRHRSCDRPPRMFHGRRRLRPAERSALGGGLSGGTASHLGAGAPDAAL
jgi:hypothetical protein